MSRYVKYADLRNLPTEYARRMLRLSNRIFGEVARPTSQKNMKIVKLFSSKPLHLNREITHFYPRHPETSGLMMKLRHYGLYRDEHEDFREEMERMRTLRGKPSTKRVPSYLRNKPQDGDK